MTGLKDIYKIKIKLIPSKTVPELKSLKFYFFGYEELPISHEHIIAKIYKDFKMIIKPQKMAIILYVATRGEIVTTIALGDKKLLEFSRSYKEENFAR
jgi:7-cyano-7-deazaguanine reductase